METLTFRDGVIAKATSYSNKEYSEVDTLAKEINAWNELKDLHKKVTQMLQKDTCAKLSALAQELAENGMWDTVVIGTVDYYAYGRDSKYDERTQLIWGKEKGFYFQQEECVQDGGDLAWKTRKCRNVKSFDSLEELGFEHIKRLAKQLPDRIRQLTASYKEDISEMERLRNSIL